MGVKGGGGWVHGVLGCQGGFRREKREVLWERVV